MLISASPHQLSPQPRTFTESTLVRYPSQRREDLGWRPSTRQNDLGRELPSDMHDRMIVLSFLAYRTNPLAHRLIEMQVNFVLGNGIYITAHDPVTLALVRAWWTNPYNQWPKKIQQRLRDLYIYGEWVHWPVVSNGLVFVRDIQPDAIDHCVADNYNHSNVETVVLKQMNVSETAQRQVPLRTIRQRFDFNVNRMDPHITGDVHLFGINRTTDTLRGVGELFPLLDFLEMYDELLFARVEKIRNMSHVWWDLTLVGMSQREIQNYLSSETNVPPAPGTMYAHNENATLKAMTADLKADDHVKDVSSIKSAIISSLGWPGTWFDDPGSAGRAVGAEMAEPALKNILGLQNFVGTILREEIDYALYHAQKAGLWEPPADMHERPAYSISFSRPSAKDFQRLGPALARFGTLLSDLQTKLNIITPAESRELAVSQIQQLGLNDMPMSMELPVELQNRHAVADASIAAVAQQPSDATTGVVTPALPEPDPIPIPIIPEPS